MAKSKVTPKLVDVEIKDLPFDRYIKMRKLLAKDGIHVQAYQPGFYSNTKRQKLDE